ncbi:MauE/DoxX family redox-associated membrane protein [Pedobacter sp. P26]|uniref:MauE/DoxX family redox-associated membrane protein n=1 Tax=Pedobacter sp. P26 TaxID=3423956 RepID=UPI003D664407
MDKKSQYVYFLSVALMSLFTYAMLNKVFDLDKFRTQVGQSVLLSDVPGIAVWFVLSIEFLAIILLWFKMTKVMGLYLSYFLMVLFSAYIVCVTRFTRDIPCSCGGILEKMSWNTHLTFNLSVTLFTLIGIILSHDNRILEPKYEDKRGEAENLGIE